MALEAARSRPLDAVDGLETVWRRRISLAATRGERRWSASHVPLSYPRGRAPGCDASPAAAGESAVVADPTCCRFPGLAGGGGIVSVSIPCVWCARGGLDPHFRRSRLTLPMSGGGRRGQEEGVSAERSEVRSRPLDVVGRPELPPSRSGLKRGIDPRVVGGVDGDAGRVDLVDAVQQLRW